MLSENDKNKIKDIIIKAGEIALNEQKKLTLNQKEDYTIVTNGDIKVSKYLEKELSNFYPVLSEENYNFELLKENETFFLIDPIDGTVSYSKKEDTWVIIVTLVYKNEPTYTIISQPKKNKLFIAEKDKGAYKEEDGVKSKLTIDKSNDDIIASPNFLIEDMELIPDYSTKGLKFEYGATLKILHICENNAAYYPISNRIFGIWDLMGAYLIIKESGGFFEFKDKNFKFDLNHKKLNQTFIASAYKFF